MNNLLQDNMLCSLRGYWIFCKIVPLLSVVVTISTEVNCRKDFLVQVFILRYLIFNSNKDIYYITNDLIHMWTYLTVNNKLIGGKTEFSQEIWSFEIDSVSGARKWDPEIRCWEIDPEIRCWDIGPEIWCWEMRPGDLVLGNRPGDLELGNRPRDPVLGYRPGDPVLANETRRSGAGKFFPMPSPVIMISCCY